jgi:hypothetical protein|tara:strand:- start:725 stop:1507 length:783 start_codon:yes stop_codon:yes gene_type:complete
MKKKSIFLTMFIGALILGSCQKKSEEVATPTLEVAEHNSTLIAKHTWIGCGACGAWAFEQFANSIENNPNEVYIAFKQGDIGEFANQAIYDHFQAAFEIPTATPTFHNNLNADIDISTAQSAQEAAGVVMNANYTMELDGDKIKLHTTTKFFQTSEGRYRITPLLIIDNIIAPQAAHPDTTNTRHKKVPVDVAAPIGGVTEPSYDGYLIASGDIKAGYTVNLECEVDRDPSWATEDISFAILMFKENSDGSLEFVNAFTK